jgi:arsenite methyltransferase
MTPLNNSDSSSDCSCGGGCCQSSNQIFNIAQTIGPFEEGETVVCIGSKGDFDFKVAANQVGTTGKITGIDMTPELVGKAKINAEKNSLKNIEFKLGEIDDLPFADNSVGVVISNCLLTLSPDKLGIFNETRRILKTGGRFAMCFTIGFGALADMPSDKNATCDLIAGPDTKEEINKILSKQGFIDIKIQYKLEKKDFTGCSDKSGTNTYLCSAIITACKH